MELRIVIIVHKYKILMVYFIYDSSYTCFRLFVALMFELLFQKKYKITMHLYTILSFEYSKLNVL